MVHSNPKRTSTPENQNASFVKNPILIQARRAVIVEAAIEVFWRKGFHSTRISDIAKVAGLSQGSIYNYIESKEALLYMVCEDHLGLYRDHVTKALAAGMTMRRRRRAILAGASLGLAKEPRSDPAMVAIMLAVCRPGSRVTSDATSKKSSLIASISSAIEERDSCVSKR